MSLVMPACLSTAESVSLVASDVSPTEPPRSSNESRNVPARRSGSNDLPDTARSGANGAALEPGGRGNGKAMTGTIASGPYLLNASLTSLPNGGRSSGSSFSVNNLAGAGDGPRAASPRKMNMSASREGPSALSPAPAARSSAERRGSSSLSHVQTIPEAVTPTQSPSMPPSSPSHTRHRRAQSASNPGSPLSPTAGPSDALRHDQSRAANRLSVASAQDSTSAQGRPSLNIPRPPSLRLQHRHTLQVPKIATGQRGSRDFSFSNTNASEDALGGSSAVATGSAHPRGSLSLVRRTTRSMHSDMFIEEIPQDPDAARWTETVRQKRASRRRRKEEEEDDRVMVGTKVDQHHQNWVTAYNMLTGIRFTVSRTNAKMDRELTASDFDARHKFSFDITGNELTPSAKYDFKFKDYAPWVFRHLRARFHIDPADYLVSLTSKYILSELGSPGKSGSFFYFSRDYKYIIKTIHHGEHKLLRKILHRYYDHVCNNPNTLISQFYGLHRVKIPYGRKIHFVVMNNLFPPHRDIHHTFDLKGSTIGREYREEDLERNPRATLKDLNWLRRNQHLELGPHKKELFLDQMRKDVALLQELGIMDYSLLVGLHDLDRGNEENLRDKTLQVFQPGGDGDREKGGPDLEPEAPGPSAFPLGPTASTAAAAAPGPGMLVRTPSKLESARKARELRAIVKREKPVPLDQSTLAMAGGHEDKKKFTFYSEDGGFRATHEDGRPGEAIYYLGIIDCLTHYGFRKRVEHLFKGMMQNKTEISAVPPDEYGERFLKFMIGITMPRETAEAQVQARALGALSEKAPPTEARQQQQPLPRGPQQQEPPRLQQPPPADAGEDADTPPDRTLRTASVPAERAERDPMARPVLEEAGENGSPGGLSARSRDPEADGMAAPPGLGVPGSPPLSGKPPPTPPKDRPVAGRGVRQVV